MKMCVSCQLPFSPTEDWMLECTVCWKLSKGYELSKSDHALKALQEGFALAIQGWKQRQTQVEEEKLQQRLVMETERRRWEQERQELQQKLQVALERYRKLKAARGVTPPSAAQATLTPERLKNLLKLCHPDRHKNSEEATEATKWLLAQRDK